jgi:hypothetical protein
METCFNYTDREHGFFSSDERKFINKVRKLKEKYPEQVRIIAEPEDNDGCIYCELPSAWLKIVPKKVLTEEHKQKLMANSKLFQRKFLEHDC